MSEKREKQIRKTARFIYKNDMTIWQNTKPPRWKIFRYFKWKKAKPSLSYIEKTIRTYVKRGE